MRPRINTEVNKLLNACLESIILTCFKRKVYRIGVIYLEHCLLATYLYFRDVPMKNGDKETEKVSEIVQAKRKKLEQRLGYAQVKLQVETPRIIPYKIHYNKLNYLSLR